MLKFKAGDIIIRDVSRTFDTPHGPEWLPIVVHTIVEAHDPNCYLIENEQYMSAEWIDKYYVLYDSPEGIMIRL